MAATALLFAALLFTPRAWAELATWIAETGDWNDSANWSGTTTGQPDFTPVPPTASDFAEINNGGTAQVFESAAVRGIMIGSHGFAGGMLDVGLGAQFNSEGAFLAASPLSHATVRLLGPATWINRGTMNIGQEGAGRVEILSGSELTNDADGPFTGYSISLGWMHGGEGTLIVDGGKLININHGITGIAVGRKGTGILEITGGGEVHNDSYLDIGQAGSSASRLTIDAGKYVGTADINLGGGEIIDNQIVRSTSTLNIQNGASVSSRFNSILTGSTATIQGATWNNTSVSVQGGTLDVNDGTTVSSSVSVSVSQPTGAMNVEGGTITAAESLFVSGRGRLNLGLVRIRKVVISSDTCSLPSDGLYVGNGTGRGTMEIRSGGEVRFTNISTLSHIDGLEGTRVWVDGIHNDMPSTWLAGYLDVGRNKFGELLITSGGYVSVIGDMDSGLNEGSTGLVTVSGKSADGRGSLLVHDDLDVGIEGTGRLNILFGGEVRGKTASVGGIAGEVIVDGAGSQWILDKRLGVGEHGDGSVIIRNGGHVQLGSSESGGRNVFIGVDNRDRIDALLSPPQVTVVGSGSVLDAAGLVVVGGSLRVNEEMETRGVGTLHISDGGHVGSRGGGIGIVSESIGTVIVDNATWASGEILDVGRHGVGLLQLRNGGAVGARRIEIGRGGVFSGVGSAIREGDVLLLVNDGTVAPGASPGTLTIDGDYTQGETGRLEIELASTTSFDVLAVTGNATLGGTLEISLLDGFMPAANDTFEFLSAASVTGAFDQILVLRDDAPAGTFDLAVTPTGLVLSGFELGGSDVLVGDYNNSGTVEQGDLDLVLLNWGADAATPPLNWTNDLPSGNIDQNELDGVLLNWGETAAVGQSVAAAVPEPATWLLLLPWLGVTLVRRRLVHTG